ncbi:MAG TPA: type IVB secretion system protein IcmH/DotU [Blastocatellia bacterium]|nr:type IVB secretion system protein IcmH/DotU [Blastocatellia bacterium]
MTPAVADKTVAIRTMERAEKDLVGLATPVLETIMRIKSGLLTPTVDLRRTIGAQLKQLEQRGLQIGYKEAQIQNAKFALASFVDETVLAGGFPIRDEWERYPLQLEYFGEQFAGVKFFERLDGLLKEVEREGDVVELYYLCLLLGYKGKYQIYLEDQLPGVLNNVAEHLRRAGRLKTAILAPHWKVDDQPVLQEQSAQGLPKWVIATVGGTVGLLLLLYIILNFSLIASTNDLKQLLLK